MTAQPYPTIDANPNFAKLEEEVLAFWQAEGVFEQSVNQRTGAADYVFYDGPPFANGLPHYGHLLTGYVKDAIARYHTMRGKRVERRFGWDCHGLPAEMGAEKELGISGRAAIADYGIGKFNEHCRTSVMKYTADWEYYVNRQGRWVDFKNDYKTMDTPFMESCLWAFKELWNKGLIYESMRVMPYSWAAETPVSNFETRMDNATRPREDLSAYVKFKLKEKPEGAPEAKNYYLIAWTTTPWTLPSNLALAVNAGMEYGAILAQQASPASGRSNPPQRIWEGVGNHEDSTRKSASVARAQEMRKNPTDAEKKLWAALSDKKLNDKKFRRQHAIGNYIVDFVCTGANLIIELDGGQHGEQADYDAARTAYLESQHYRVLRFWNNEVMQNLEGVLTVIAEALVHPPESASALSTPRERGMVPVDCYFLAQPIAEKFAEILKGEAVGALKGDALIGLTYEPLFPYFADTPNAFRVLDGSAFVTDGDGTGIVHMAPGFGEVDQQCCAENGIEVIVPVDEKGRFIRRVQGVFNSKIFNSNTFNTDQIGIYDFDGLKLVGLTVVPDTRLTNEQAILQVQDSDLEKLDPRKHDKFKEQVAKFGLANMRIVRWLDDNGKLVKTEPYTHNYPHCWRTDTPLIYRAMSSWYVNVQKIKANMVENNQTIHWIPDHVQAGQMGKGIETAPDWSISRNRFWGTPIPIWKSASGKIHVCGSIEEIEKLSGQKVTDLHRPFIDDVVLKIDGEEYTRIEDVFDCWFESGSMPFAQLHYPFENKQQFEKNFPADFITEYIAQTRGWFYTLQVLSAALFGKAPFKNVICHGVVIDEETGLKYSKRLKNYRDPKEVMDYYGADALRWLMLASPVMRGSDLGVDPEGKFIRDVVRLNIKPMWSAYYFFTLYANADKIVASGQRSVASKENLLDRYILAKCKAAVNQVKSSLDAYDTLGATEAITSFFEVLNNWYIRRSRARFWGAGVSADKQAAFDTLFTVLTLMCRAAAPLLPFVSEAIYRGLHASFPPESASTFDPPQAGHKKGEGAGNKDAEPSPVYGGSQSVAMRGGNVSVHLTDFPDVSGMDSADQLVADMDWVRDVCNAGAAVRNKQNIRNRQPLASISVIGVTRDFMFDVVMNKDQFFKEIIQDELNIKSCFFQNKTDDELKEFAELKLSINSAVLGKRIPEKMKAILPASKKGDWKRLNDNRVSVAGETLEFGEFTLRLEPNNAYEKSSAPLSTNDALVILDLTITPELAAEGTARDLVRMVQQARKDAGLQVSDRIDLSLAVPASFASALELFGDYIAEQTLATSLIQTPLAAHSFTTTQEVEGEAVTIQLAKAA